MGSKLKYVDSRPVYIPVLSKYKQGIVPKRGEVIEVSDNEKKQLMKMKNGHKDCWEEVKARRSEPKQEGTE